MTVATATANSTQQDLPSQIIAQLTAQMPEPWLEHQKVCQACFNEQDWKQVRHIAAENLDDPLCKAYSYMCSIPKMPPTLAVLLSEAARAIADAHRDAAIVQLNKINGELLKAV